MIRLGLDAVDQVRRRVQHETLGHRGHAGDPLFRIRRLLRRGHDHHTERSWARLVAGLAAGDWHEQVGRAWIAAQELRLLYREPDRDRAERRLLRWFTEAVNSLIKKVKRIGHGYRNFTNYRLRLLLHCGVTSQTPPVTPIRGRLPRLAA